MPDVPSSVVETDTVKINMMVDSSTADSEWSDFTTGPPCGTYWCIKHCGLLQECYAFTEPLFIALAYVAIPFLLVTPLVTSILQIVLASEAIAKYNTNNTMHHFDGTDSAKGFSMIHDGNIFILASYPVVLCVFGCGYGLLFASAMTRHILTSNQVDDNSAGNSVDHGFIVLFSTLIVPSISTVVVFVMTAPIAPEFYSSDLHVARMLALVTSSIKLFFITLIIVRELGTVGR